MRTIFPIVLLAFSTGSIQAQDTLYRSNGTLQVVSVLEMKENAIRYNTIPSDGSIYSLSTSAISKIAFRDGAVKAFLHISPATSEDKMKVDPRATDFGRNFIAFNGLNVPLDQLTLSYERTAADGKWSFRIPVSVRLARQDSIISYNTNNDRTKTFSTGIEWNAYPYGQGKTKFFYGPAIEVGKRNFFFPSYGNGRIAVHDAKTTYFALLLRCGFLFQFTRHINLSAGVAGGLSKSNLRAKYPEFYSSYSRSKTLIGRAEINIGYKF